LSLTAVDGTVYASNPLTHRRLFLGVESILPATNFENGAEFDDSSKFNVTNTSGSTYFEKKNSGRSFGGKFSKLTNTEVRQIKHLDFELDKGYCFVMIENDSTDADDFFIANYNHTRTTFDKLSRKTLGVTFNEHHEYI